MLSNVSIYWYNRSVITRSPVILSVCGMLSSPLFATYDISGFALAIDMIDISCLLLGTRTVRFTAHSAAYKQPSDDCVLCGHKLCCRHCYAASIGTIQDIYVTVLEERELRCNHACTPNKQRIDHYQHFELANNPFAGKHAHWMHVKLASYQQMVDIWRSVRSSWIGNKNHRCMHMQRPGGMIIYINGGQHVWQHA